MREELETRVERPAAGPAAIGADEQVLLDGQAREDAPALGHQRDAAAHAAVRGQPADRRRRRSAPRRAAPAAAPAIASSSVVLPAPLAPMMRHGLALVDLERRCRTAPGSRRRSALERARTLRAGSLHVDPQVDALTSGVGHHRRRARRRRASGPTSMHDAAGRRPRRSACTMCSIQTMAMPLGAGCAAIVVDQLAAPRARSGRRRSRRAAARRGAVASARASSSRLRSSSVSVPAARLALRSRPVSSSASSARA